MYSYSCGIVFVAEGQKNSKETLAERRKPYAMGIVAGGLGALWKWVRGKFRTLDAMKEANLALLHDRLYQGCKHYIAQGHIDVDSLKNIEYLYRAYHALGGNGTGTELYTRVQKLPIKED